MCGILYFLDYFFILKMFSVQGDATFKGGDSGPRWPVTMAGDQDRSFSYGHMGKNLYDRFLPRSNSLQCWLNPPLILFQFLYLLEIFFWQCHIFFADFWGSLLSPVIFVRPSLSSDDTSLLPKQVLFIDLLIIYCYSEFIVICNHLSGRIFSRTLSTYYTNLMNPPTTTTTHALGNGVWSNLALKTTMAVSSWGHQNCHNQ